MEMGHVFGGDVVRNSESKTNAAMAVLSNVVSLGARTRAMSFPAISQVDAYWEGLRQGRLMPERAEVDPRGIESALANAFLLELVAPGVARIRVAGLHLSDLLGMEVRGMPLTAFFEPQARAKVAEALDRVVNEAQVADLRISSGAGVGRPALNARLYLAPLGNGGQGYPRLLGCLQSIGEIGRAPRRFGVDKTQMRRIVASAGAAKTPDCTTPKPAPAQPQFAEAPAAYRPAPRDAKPAPKQPREYLRLVKTDE